MPHPTVWIGHLDVDNPIPGILTVDERLSCPGPQSARNWRDHSNQEMAGTVLEKGLLTKTEL